MYCDLLSQYIQVWKLFKGGNYSRKYGMSFNESPNAYVDKELDHRESGKNLGRS